MPFRRNGPRLPRKRMLGKPRKPHIPDPRTAVGLAQLAWAGVKKLKQLVNSEKYKFDVSISITSQTGTANITLLNAIPVGDTESTRTGNSILQKHLYLKSAFALPSSEFYSRSRMVVVQDNQQIGDTAPSFTDVYESASTIALLNKSTVGRFSILYDKQVVLDSNRPLQVWDKYITLNNHARFNGTGASDIQKNGLYLMTLSSSSPTGPSIDVKSRIAYHDN